MNRGVIVMTFLGLTQVAVEKVLAFGYEDVKEDVERMRLVLEDVNKTCGLDGSLLEAFNLEVETARRERDGNG